LRKVERALPCNRNNTLHWASCRFGNIIAEGRINPKVAEQLLIAAAKINGIWREDGREDCIATIRSGLRAGIAEAELLGFGAEQGACVWSIDHD
jgi:hypothetical protein